jgi:hypothetical protein
MFANVIRAMTEDNHNRLDSTVFQVLDARLNNGLFAEGK